VDVLGTVINCVLVVLTFAVVWFAWQTVRESRKATTAAQETVTAVGKLLAVAQETAASSAASVEAARQTVEIAREARQADERHRQLEQLRVVGRTVQRIKLGALEAMRLRESVGQLADPRWRSADQNALGILLVGVEPPLPECKALVGESQAGQVLAKAAAAEAELEAVFRGLGIG
jgi:hypothetical protein